MEEELNVTFLDMDIEEDTLINYTTPEMDRYDRVYLDSIPVGMI